MDRPAVFQVLEGGGERGNMEETGFEVICGAPTNPTVKGQVKEGGKIKSISAENPGVS